jgi:hypothetical protein
VSNEQALFNNIGLLTVETGVLSLVIVHLLSREAKASDDPEKWVRNFADEIHSSMDRSNPPIDLQNKIEIARDRPDHIMSAVRLRIAK